MTSLSLDGTTTETSVERIEEVLKTALSKRGFGILTRIDVQATLEKKLGVQTPRRVILGACNPRLAHQALEVEPLFSLVMPCNVVIEEHPEGSRVAMANPVAMMGSVGREDLVEVAESAVELLQAALDEALVELGGQS